MVAWSVQLSEFDVSFKRRGHIKAQVLADFITELTPLGTPTTDGEWYLSVDGSSNQTGSGVGVILESPDEVIIEQSLHFEFKASNNQAEYEALLAGMRLACELEAKRLIRVPNKRSVVGQVLGVGHEDGSSLQEIRTSTRPSRPKRVGRPFGQTSQHVEKSMPTIDHPEVWCVEEKVTWMSPFIQYFKDDQVSSFSFPLLKCIEGDEATYVIREVHEGTCGTHIGGRALANKIARAGYYWPTLKSDCMKYVKKCDKCQRFAEGHKAPQNAYNRSPPLGHSTNGESTY
ncbi:hypothetical protein CR513_33790, partial [Mucuna pruriens]